MSDYLWDKTGEPDQSVVELERALAPLAYRSRPAPLVRPRRRALVYAAAAMLALSVVVAFFFLGRRRPDGAGPGALARSPAGPSWAARVTGGVAYAGGRTLDGETRLGVGEWLETGTSRVRLAVAGIGAVELAPGTRARIVETGPARHRLALARGRLAAEVVAPPRLFAVETPRVVVTDLGCAFSVDVDEAGRGRVVVTGGRVALAAGAREVEVAAGAECELTHAGPGTPLSSDAPPAFRSALARYAADPAALPELLATARPKDRLTLTALLDGAGARVLIQHRLDELARPDHAAPEHPSPRKSTRATKPRPGTGTATETETAPAPARKPTPTPTRKPDPGPHLTHDPFKDLRP